MVTIFIGSSATSAASTGLGQSSRTSTVDSHGSPDAGTGAPDRTMTRVDIPHYSCCRPAGVAARSTHIY
ncbi:hypothetical protein SBC2_09430 [Caballeronia sp. SBC2]|nr:hypothetical protein SBC2_09430 [Caballeronia sp. SBC2]